ncbi:MAG: hypothetical protein IT174_17130, partial [Acidobacteria bacterium]|nr:hypothetical protein [Acidobacteriota bacterium]
MKTLAGIALFVLLGISVNGQSMMSRTMFESSGMTERTIKGAPFSALEVNESIQTFADGNRIVRSSTNKLYRSNEGRFRREVSGSSGGSWGTFYSFGPEIMILDPIGGYRYMLDTKAKSVRTGRLRLSGTRPSVLSPAEKVNNERKRVELNSVAAAEKGNDERKRVELNAVAAAKLSNSLSADGQSDSSGHGRRMKYDTRTEDLGTRTVEGVRAVGKRTITTIPAGDIGNERAIEIVYEKWYSNDLQLVVMSKHTDPRFGEQTYRLTNILRNEPDPSLFEVPAGYKVVTESRGGYSFGSSRSGEGGQNSVWT